MSSKTSRGIRITALVCMAFAWTLGWGESAPDFSLKDLDGGTVTLKELRGKVAIIDFWAIWCKTCKEAFGPLTKMQEENKEKGLRILGINLDKKSADKVAAFVKKAKIGYKVALDPEGSTTGPFGVKGVPTLIVLDRKGNIAGKFRGYDKSEGEKIREMVAKLLAQAP